MLFVLLSALAVCSQAIPNLVLDDFSAIKTSSNSHRSVNLLGGEYGTDGKTTYSYHSKSNGKGYITVTPKSHQNYFYFKVDPKACYDLSQYTGLSFDLSSVSKDANFKVTMTSMNKGCKERGLDSVYKNITEFVKLAQDNHAVSVFLPFKAFNKFHKTGGDYDLKHFKDFTFTDIHGVFKFSKFTLVGDSKPTKKADQVANNKSNDKDDKKTNEKKSQGTSDDDDEDCDDLAATESQTVTVTQTQTDAPTDAAKPDAPAAPADPAAPAAPAADPTKPVDATAATTTATPTSSALFFSVTSSVLLIMLFSIVY